MKKRMKLATSPPSPISPVCVSKFVSGSSSSDFCYWCRWKIITETIVYIYRMLTASTHRYPKGDARTLSSVQISQLFCVSTKTIRRNLNEFQLQSQDFSISYAAIPLIINFLTMKMQFIFPLKLALLNFYKYLLQGLQSVTQFILFLHLPYPTLFVEYQLMP